MIELGNYNTLEILRDTSVGLFLGDEEGNDVLLPNKYVPEIYEIGDKLTVFCYLDFDERPVVTSLTPYIFRNTFKLLKVVEVNNIGAFLDWGLEKHLLVPFREQRERMQEGQWYVVYCYLDEKSFRLVASNKLDKFLDNEELTVEVNEEVDLIVTRQNDLGWDVIINNKHKGLVYSDQVFKKVAVGDAIKGYIKHIRPDNKIDVNLKPIGYESIEPAANVIYARLQKEGGYLNLHDKSSPDEITAKLQMSKKVFKKSIGTLYKDRKITIKSDGIYLL
ncbi:GntR family transcriptional regulator [Cellulophaga sp. HaHa_2_95]|uniref:CvfB family protein n=1 Tax=unclassified Cellulophaga TaxID=2634405 RepID=UPI001C4E87EA|nr:MULTISPECIES: S1-like domain-containing RNA-binding protein [unclassified Cellulophaga]QXP52696.1 GntR family transcriptional regulator [Cellulophaga sp. HaHa_2_1]QXP55022.1 GntR family transcriptional regulator [Cellulophaga sp. HaHa_2_95]